MTTRRKRTTYATLTAIVILLGLISRSDAASALPGFIGAYAGDTLWALTLFLMLGTILPEARTGVLAVATIVVSFGVELSQLYQAPWINAIRETKLGALALGAGFKWSDLICYTVGCALGAVPEFVIARRPPTKPMGPSKYGVEAL